MTTTVQREDVEGLIKRLEEASKGSRELDFRTAYALGWRFNGCSEDGETIPEEDWPHLGEIGGHWHKPGDHFADINDKAEYRDPERGFASGRWDEPPAYTTSLDAALTLVPEHCAISNFSIWPGEISEVDILGTHGEKDGRRWHNIRDGKWVGAGLTGPLALCIAALRARASQ